MTTTASSTGPLAAASCRSNACSCDKDTEPAATGARAAVRYTPQPWGTELEASVSGTRPGTRCQIWVTTDSGQHASGNSWTVTHSAPRAGYPASVPFPVSSLTGFDITTGGPVLVAIALRTAPNNYSAAIA
jgi:hypothetical protein